MVEISNNRVVSINKGDLVSLPLFINQGNKMYPIRFSMLSHPESVLYFSIMRPNESFENGIIKKRYICTSLHTN